MHVFTTTQSSSSNLNSGVCSFIPSCVLSFVRYSALLWFQPSSSWQALPRQLSLMPTCYARLLKEHTRSSEQNGADLPTHNLHAHGPSSIDSSNVVHLDESRMDFFPLGVPFIARCTRGFPEKGGDPNNLITRKFLLLWFFFGTDLRKVCISH